MASLALLVAIIFLIVLIMGPMTLLASYFGLFLITILLSILSILIGFYWSTVSPFPVNLIGIFDIFCAVYALSKL